MCCPSVMSCGILWHVCVPFFVYIGRSITHRTQWLSQVAFGWHETSAGIVEWPHPWWPPTRWRECREAQHGSFSIFSQNSGGQSMVHRPGTWASRFLLSRSGKGALSSGFAEGGLVRRRIGTWGEIAWGVEVVSNVPRNERLKSAQRLWHVVLRSRSHKGCRTWRICPCHIHSPWDEAHRLHVTRGMFHLRPSIDLEVGGVVNEPRPVQCRSSAFLYRLDQSGQRP